MVCLGELWRESVTLDGNLWHLQPDPFVSCLPLPMPRPLPVQQQRWCHNDTCCYVWIMFTSCSTRLPVTLKRKKNPAIKRLRLWKSTVRKNLSFWDLNQHPLITNPTSPRQRFLPDGVQKNPWGPTWANRKRQSVWGWTTGGAASHWTCKKMSWRWN